MRRKVYWKVQRFHFSFANIARKNVWCLVFMLCCENTQLSANHSIQFTLHVYQIAASRRFIYLSAYITISARYGTSDRASTCRRFNSRNIWLLDHRQTSASIPFAHTHIRTPGGERNTLSCSILRLLANAWWVGRRYHYYCCYYRSMRKTVSSLEATKSSEQVANMNHRAGRPSTRSGV